MKTALSIAGTDPSGGAGIQADLKTMTMNGVFAMSAITALVAQNTTGVKAMHTKTGLKTEQRDGSFDREPSLKLCANDLEPLQRLFGLL